jgi:hypothetical protein
MQPDFRRLPTIAAGIDKREYESQRDLRVQTLVSLAMTASATNLEDPLELAVMNHADPFGKGRDREDRARGPHVLAWRP